MIDANAGKQVINKGSKGEGEKVREREEVRK
jgi:hypothetical protein